VDSFPDFSCVCACASGEEALRVIPAAKPDVVLLAIALPQLASIKCTIRLRDLLPQTLILLLTGVQQDHLVFPALEAGADGFLPRRPQPADLHRALLDVLSGGAPMPSDIARRVVVSFRKKSKAGADSVTLTAREEETLIRLSQGHSNKEIADRLGLGIETVRSHLKHLYEKMRVHSRTDAVAQYLNAKTRSRRVGGA
jgi:DNA-binding NarL/FixJ family response regulator